jgi:Fe-S cluster biogenesis protein NfuA
MANRQSVQDTGDRIEKLLDEVRSMAAPRVWERVEETIRAVVDLYGKGLLRIVEIIGANDPANELTRRMTADELVASLLILHGLHPETFATRVRKALDRVRPYLGSHGGDVELIDTDESSGLVRLRMKGSCEDCPSSVLTVKLAVESAIKEAAPEAVRIEVEGMTERSGGDSTGAVSDLDGPKSWVVIQPPGGMNPGRIVASELNGLSVVLCTIDAVVYAYQNACAACGSGIATGAIEFGTLICPSCKHRFDLRKAGRSMQNRDLHLIPLPLLREPDGIKLAIAGMGTAPSRTVAAE